MPLYTDVESADSTVICIGTEDGGDSLCGGFTTERVLNGRYGPTVWHLIADGRIHQECEDGAADLFGADSWRELVEWAEAVVEEADD